MRVIFYHPATVGGRASGSGLRPAKMLAALKARYAVEEISGSRTERRKRIREVKAQIRSGERFAFLYIENLSSPLTFRTVAFRGRFPVPIPNLIDLRFFLFCRRHRIPTGYFYRDIHWAFPEAYGGTLSRKRLALLRFYGRVELWFLRSFVTNVFVPTTEFQAFLKQRYGVESRPLPPGGELPQLAAPERPTAEKKLRLFYVGGCGPLYDPTVFFRGLENALGAIRMDYCTRESEWARFGDRYPHPENVSLVHATGDELLPYYERADVCVLLVPPVGYGALAFSFKVGEYLCSGKPLIVYSGTSVASLVETFDIGWVVEYRPEAVARLLTHLASTPDEVARKTENARQERHRFSWHETVRSLAEALV